MLGVRGVGIGAGVLVAVAVACGGTDDASPSGSSSGGASGSSGTAGVDAGGGGGAAGSTCRTDDDCESRCAAGVCTAPTTTDGKRSPSLGETDVDCGGPSAPKCDDGRGCGADTDCTTGVCATSKKCVTAPSCRGTNGPSGVETCGTAEPGTPGATVESCCRSLPLPKTTTRRLDKYEITAGRIREFITALAAANAGNPDVRSFAKAQASANPTSQLGQVMTKFPGLLDILPANKAPTSTLPLPVHLGAFPLDRINELDGCFVGPDAYGHATYWQPPEDLKPLGVGYPSNDPDGVRRYSREVLDAKPMNCMMPLVFAAFCAWDGGELALTTDYREVWGRQSVVINEITLFHPWDQLVPIGGFNWRNGQGAEACPIPGWCTSAPTEFYRFPASGATLADDGTPSIAAPGRFPQDVTKAKSANGEGWYDIAGNLMEAAWPTAPVDPGPVHIVDVCDASATSGGAACSRPQTGATGVRRFAGELPQIALIGYSFEGHRRRSEAYLSSTDGDHARLIPNDLKPATFQYGKVGARCARPQ